MILISLAIIWDLFSRPLARTMVVFLQGIGTGELPARAWGSIKVLLVGYAIGVILATLLIALAIASRIGRDFLETMTSMFNPLPAITLLPLALIWFGMSNATLVFVHSVTWAIALNIHTGFLSVSKTLKMVGAIMASKGARYIAKIPGGVPQAF